jgi:hypothetical protein
MSALNMAKQNAKSKEKFSSVENSIIVDALKFYWSDYPITEKQKSTIISLIDKIENY